jgi:asparagine synthetase B (glutamine-hydrolysing)
MQKPNLFGSIVSEVLLDELAHVKASGKKAAVLLSSGVDSHSVLFACLRLGIPTEAYSFSLQGRESRDYKYAQATAKEFGVPFVRVTLPTSVESLKKFLLYAVAHGARGKTDFECMWPMTLAFRKAASNGCGYVISGTSADSHFALSKKACMHYKDKVDDYRRIVFSKRNTGQKILLRSEAARLGMEYMAPYDTTRMCSALHGYTWDQLNRPKQKQPIREAFALEFERIKTTQHTNLQLGDSGIAEHFESLLSSDWNAKYKFKSVVGIYNKLVDGAYGKSTNTR